MYPGQVHRYHWGFDDPADAQGTDVEVLEKFRAVRDEIAKVFEAYAAGLRFIGNDADTRALGESKLPSRY